MSIHFNSITVSQFTLNPSVQELAGPISSLPSELIILIFQQLKLSEIGQSSFVSKKWKHLADTDLLWQFMGRFLAIPSLQGKHALLSHLRDLLIMKPFNSDSEEVIWHVNLVEEFENEIYGTLDQVQLVLNARDKLLVWKRLGPCFDLSVPDLPSLDSFEKVIEQATHFASWFAEHKTKLQRYPQEIFSANLTSLPSEIGQLTQLTYLDISINNLKNDLPEIQFLTQLKSLLLSCNQLISLPSEITQLTNLRCLHCQHNQLSVLHSEISHLPLLQELFLADNQFVSLPTECNWSKQLRSLDLSGNGLSLIPAEFGSLIQLKWLNLSRNQIASVPVEFGNLTQLHTLSLYYNKLKSLPSTIGQLQALKFLGISSNKLRSIPAQIGLLTKLENLFLDQNRLTSLPFEIGRLTQLHNLALSYNHLATLPKEIELLTNLKDIFLFKNPLIYIPDEIKSKLLLDEKQKATLELSCTII